MVFCDRVDAVDIDFIGPRFEHAPYFPERINTEFIRVVNPSTIKMRVWERGSGETMACGTGACAAVAAAIASAYRDRPLPAELVAMGEIGLTGELRPVSQPEQRFREAVRLGFGNVVAAPLKSGAAAAKKLDLKLYSAANLQIALSFMGLI